MRCRYAPSPTGFLHLGNARTALLAYLQAKSLGAAFVLRVEDLDSQRSKAQYVTANLRELRWLGLVWDEGPDVQGPYAPYCQSARHHLYREALGRLEKQERTFACYLSRKDLQGVASAPHGQPAVYGELERKLNRERGKHPSKAPSQRFKVQAQTIVFEDIVMGPQRFSATGGVGDFILKRADGAWAYQFAVVVDDIAMEVSHVLRAADLLASSAAQLLLYEALGSKSPTFAHVPLLLDENGTRLAKRQGSLTLTSLRDAGVRAERVVGLLAYSLGMLPELTAVSVQELVGGFDLRGLPKDDFRLELQHLEWLQG